MSPLRKKRFAWIPFALAGGILLSCRNDIDEIRALTDDREVAVQTVMNGTFYYTEKGSLTNVLEAAVLDRFEGENPRIEVTGGFLLTMYDSAGQVDATLKAIHGTFWDFDGRLLAREQVELINAEGSKLNTEELHFVQDSDRVYTDLPVAITTEDGVIYGTGLVSDSRFKKRQIKQVTGTMYFDDSIEENTDEQQK
jgi:LPS export ABC transporter protein LptC